MKTIQKTVPSLQTPIVCPNCGALTTNQLNCEYCGSLTVRFTADKAAIAKSYCSSESFIYPTLEKALEINSLLQLSHANVVTDIYFYDKDNKWGSIAVIKANVIGDNNKRYFPDEVDGHLAIACSFDFRLKTSWCDEKKERERICKFESLPSLSLFTRQSYMMDEGYYDEETDQFVDTTEYRRQCFYIDFGCDYRGTAVIISEILTEVYGLQKDYTPLICTRADAKESDEHIDSMRKRYWEYAHKYGPNFWITQADQIDLSRLTDYVIVTKEKYQKISDEWTALSASNKAAKEVHAKAAAAHKALPFYKKVTPFGWALPGLSVVVLIFIILGLSAQGASAISYVICVSFVVLMCVCLFALCINWDIAEFNNTENEKKEKCLKADLERFIPE